MKRPPLSHPPTPWLTMQLISNLVDWGMDPQTAIDCPRFAIGDGSANGEVTFEEGTPEAVIACMRARGHRVAATSPVGGWARSLFGRAQIILRDRQTGVLWGASDGRGDGCAMPASGAQVKRH